MKLLRCASIAIGLVGLGLGGAPALAQHHGGHGNSGGHGSGSHGSSGHGSGASFRSHGGHQGGHGSFGRGSRSSFRSHGGHHGGHGRGVTFGTFYAPGGYYYGGYPYDYYDYGYPGRAYGYRYRRSLHRRCRTVWERDDYTGEEVPVRVCRR